MLKKYLASPLPNNMPFYKNYMHSDRASKYTVIRMIWKFERIFLNNSKHEHEAVFNNNIIDWYEAKKLKSP